MLQDAALTQYWQAREDESTGIQQVMAWLDHQQGQTPDQHPDCQHGLQQLDRVLTTIDPTQAQNALAETATADQFMYIVANTAVRRSMRLLFWGIEQTNGQVLNALQRLAEQEPAAAQLVVAHWQQICRWTTLQRMCTPERLAAVQAAITRSQQNLGIPTGAKP